ncbi:hypothetical protein RHSIM_Rhsim08G0063400 [Rhododendron simsii]|uniref:Uncharacterized protein n=1 Tax=Rhododendron simsii TaxID=118357 RepID=A0A834GHU3_RHOSS|nr:hypothetical protein RHSIM_Rhsim08G0063400 [Rhododendron simsii]
MCHGHPIITTLVSSGIAASSDFQDIEVEADVPRGARGATSAKFLPELPRRTSRPAQDKAKEEAPANVVLVECKG